MIHDSAPTRSARHRMFASLAALAVLAAMTTLASSPAAGATNVPIYEIQGDAHLSDWTGQEVTTSGVVTAVAFRSFYIQDPTGDGNSNTSDGIFVNSRTAVGIGDEVEITATVEESIPGGSGTGNLSITRLNSATVTVLSSGNPRPAPVEIGRKGLIPPAAIVISADELPTNLQTDPAVFNPSEDGIDFYETLEGMYVEIDRPVAISATRQFSSFSSEVFVLPSRGKLMEPDDAGTSRGGILLQPHPDNLGDQNPERMQIQFDGTIFPAAPPAIQVGDRLGDVRGVVGYSFGNYEVNASEVFSIKTKDNRVEVSNLKPKAKKVTIASYNVLNLSPGSSDDAQRAKLASQIVTNLASPDVVALQEIQDNSGTTDDEVTAADQTLQALVDAIAAAGAPTYSFFDVAPADGSSGGVPGGNIRNAFLYNPARVDLVDFVSLTPAELVAAGVTNPAAFTGTRNPLVGVFSFRGVEFSIVNNHLTSRFGSTPIFGGPQPFVQAGESEREAQVMALNEYVAGLLADDEDANVMVSGDLNTFEWTNDLADILPSGSIVENLSKDHLSRRDKKNNYTFIFDGNSQALDHMFVTEAMLDQLDRFDVVHMNVDYSRLFSDVTASDHEALLARFKLED